MTKSEFVKGMIILRKEQEDLDRRRIRLKREWISANTDFAIGSIILLRGREYKVKKIDCDVTGRITYFLQKIMTRGRISSYVCEESDSSQMTLIKK